MGDDLRDVPSRADQAVDRAEYRRLSWETVRDRLLHDDFGGDGTPPARQRQRWLDVHAVLERVKEQDANLARCVEALENIVADGHEVYSDPDEPSLCRPCCAACQASPALAAVKGKKC